MGARTVWTHGLINSSHLSREQGAGNSFLGGLAAGLVLTNGDVFEGKRWATTLHHKRFDAH